MSTVSIQQDGANRRNYNALILILMSLLMSRGIEAKARERSEILKFQIKK